MVESINYKVAYMSWTPVVMGDRQPVAISQTDRKVIETSGTTRRHFASIPLSAKSSHF